LVAEWLSCGGRAAICVAARNYIKSSLERMRAALEKVEAQYKTIEKKAGQQA
jgi:hypothetical protein